MRKIMYSLLICCFLIRWMSPVQAEASQTTTYTYTMVDGNKEFARTQDAYIPERTVTELGLSSPADIFIDEDDILYIADTGNRRIVLYDTVTDKKVAELTYAEFKTPKGVCVTKNGDIYVADSSASAVFIFDRTFELIKKIERPDVPAFGDTAFDPHKVAADENGNIYVVGEGVSNGIIQLSVTGEFLGFFAVNQTELTFLQKIQSVFFTREQMEKLSDFTPSTFANVGIDYRGIVYTVTGGKAVNAVKKHKTNGSNMFAQDVYTQEDTTDVWVDDNLFIYASSKTGYIDVYTPAGELIFEFGSKETLLDVAGLFNSLVSIAVDSDGYIWAADGAKGYLQSYRPTEYTKQLYTALNLYENGYYDESLEVWKEVLALNQMSVIAHNGIANAYAAKYDFSSAMDHYEVAGNHEKYSDAFWELRNVWLQKYLSYFLIAAVLLFATVYMIKKLDKKRRVAGFFEKTGSKILRTKGIRDVVYAGKIMKHPLDGYYDIRVGKQGTVVGASVWYLLLFGTFMLYTIGKGFIYQYQDVQDMDMSSIVIGFFALFSLFVVCNYLVTSINDGEGSLKEVYLLTGYAVMPLTLAFLTVTVLSYVVTTNEAFLLTFLLMLGGGWSILLVFLGLQTIHNYSFKATVASVLLTFLLMAIVVIVVMVVTIMWDQVWSFLTTVGEELKQYVLG